MSTTATIIGMGLIVDAIDARSTVSRLLTIGMLLNVHGLGPIAGKAR